MGNSQQLICVFRSFRFRPFHLNIFSADKLNKDPISLYTQPLPVIDLCLQPAACSGLSPLSALQLTSANKGIILVVQQSSTPLSVWMIICVLTSEDWRWRARFQKCSNPVVLVQPNVGKKWRVLHIPRGSQTTTAHCTNHRSVSGYTPQTWSSRVLLIVAGGGNIGTLLHGCQTSNAREMTCRCYCRILLTPDPRTAK